MAQQPFERGFFFTLLLVSGVLVFFILLPYLSTILLATTVAVMVWPVHERISNGIKLRSISALISTLVVCAVFLAPLTAISFQLFFEAKSIYVYLSGFDTQNTIVSQLSQQLEQIVGSYLPSLTFDVHDYLQQGVEWFVSNLGGLFSSLVLFTLHTFLFLLALFFLFRDGDRLLVLIKKISPLSDRDDQRIFDTLGAAINSVVRGALVIAIVQGMLAGIGMTIFGVPNAILWGSVTVMAALIPTVGTSLIIIPAVGYLALTGHNSAALGLGLWGLTAVGLIDNVLGPTMVGKGARIHPYLILLAVLGGLNFFGPFGFIFGPLVMSLFLALIQIYLELRYGNGRRRLLR